WLLGRCGRTACDPSCMATPRLSITTTTSPKVSPPATRYKAASMRRPTTTSKLRRREAMPIALSEPQLDQIKTIAEVPRRLRAQSLRPLAELPPQEFGDGDLWRAAHQALREVLLTTRRFHRAYARKDRFNLAAQQKMNSSSTYPGRIQ